MQLSWWLVINFNVFSQIGHFLHNTARIVSEMNINLKTTPVSDVLSLIHTKLNLIPNANLKYTQWF